LRSDFLIPAWILVIFVETGMAAWVREMEHGNLHVNLKRVMGIPGGGWPVAGGGGGRGGGRGRYSHRGTESTEEGDEERKRRGRGKRR
jgi:hypothetical protein